MFQRQRMVSPALREAPRGLCCVMCAQDGRYPPAVGLCHLPHYEWGFGAGVGEKCPDWLGAHLCHDCHTYTDGPLGRNDHPWRARAFALTIQRLIHLGILVIRGENHAIPENEAF